MTRRTFSCLPLASMAAAAPTRLRLAGSAHLSMSPLHLGMERGYFDAAGLQLELFPLTRSAEAIPVLSRGDLDIALYSLSPPLLNAIAKGVRIRLVAAREQALPNCGEMGALFARSPITKVSELKGKKVAHSGAASIGEFALHSQLAQAGLTPQDIQVIPLRPSEAAAAMMRGEIDALSGSDLGNFKALKRPGINFLTNLGRTRPGFQFGYITFGRTLIEGPSDVGARFLSAYFRSVREYLSGATPKYMTDFAEKAGLDLDAVRSACRSHASADGRIDTKSLELFIQWAQQSGYCEHPVAAASLLDERFLKAAQIR